jgi:hypothetical protein
VLGRQQDALARQHERASRRLHDRLRAILDGAIAKGTATTIDK